MLEYYLKIKLSCFDSGFTIPKEYEECFIQNVDIPLSTSRKVMLIFKNKKYEANILKANIKKGDPYFTLRYGKEFMNKLKEEFIYSYIRFQDNMQKNIKTKNVNYNEVLKFRAIDPYIFHLETFIKQKTEFENLFLKLLKEDFFSWLKSDERDQLIVNTSEWFDRSLVSQHKGYTSVIYYLIDESKKEIYIGSANKLGDRVVPGRHEIPGWNKFRYDIIKPEYEHLKIRIENEIINAFARVLNSNIKNIFPYTISEYKLVNKTCYHK
jgi:hypothetical protein